MKKRMIKIIAILFVIGAVGGAGYYYRDGIMDLIYSIQASGKEDKVYVERISAVMGYATGDTSRYNGIVETQGAYEVMIDSARSIGEVLVKVGDTVTEGQELATYDTGEIDLQMQLAELELESINNEIESFKKEIEAIKLEMQEMTDEEDKYSSELEIKSIENSILQSELDLAAKQIEIDNFKKQVEESKVISKYNGVVKEINENGYDTDGDSAAFMKIMESGKFRVKASIDEQNVWMLEEGQAVIIRSRVDENKTWTGKVTKLATDTVIKEESDYDESSGESATKYPFYIELDSMEGLLLGQHVHVEMDEGQEEEQKGVWLYSSYIVQEESGTYVWIANDNMKLEKRMIELGEYDSELDEYEILSGLTEKDYIAWNMAGLEEGMTAVTNIEDVDYESPLYSIEENEEIWGEEYDTEAYWDEEEFYDEYEEDYDESDSYEDEFDDEAAEFDESNIDRAYEETESEEAE